MVRGWYCIYYFEIIDCWSYTGGADSNVYGRAAASTVEGDFVADIMYYEAFCGQEVVPGFAPGILLWRPFEAPAIAVAEDY